MGINLNREPPTTRISEFLSDLSIMDNDYKKVTLLENFIFHLEDERKKIVDSPYQLVFSLLYLNEAIDRFKELKGVCEVQAFSKGLIPWKNNFDRDARAEDIPVINLVSDDEEEVNVSVRTVTGLKPIITYPRHFRKKRSAQQNGNGGALRMVLGQKRPDPSIRGGIPVSSALMIRSGPPVRSGFETPSLMIGQEPPVKQRRTWSDFVVTLGGQQLAATRKNVDDYMRAADIKENDITSHWLKNTPSLPQSHNPLIAGQDTMNMNRNATKSGSQQIGLRIGGSSNVQMAAAAAANKAAQDRLRVRGMMFPSGPRQMHFHVGEPSNREMAMAANKGKFV